MGGGAVKRVLRVPPPALGCRAAPELQRSPKVHPPARAALRRAAPGCKLPSAFGLGGTPGRDSVRRVGAMARRLQFLAHGQRATKLPPPVAPACTRAVPACKTARPQYGPPSRAQSASAGERSPVRFYRNHPRSAAGGTGPAKLGAGRGSASRAAVAPSFTSTRVLAARSGSPSVLSRLKSVIARCYPWQLKPS